LVTRRRNINCALSNRSRVRQLAAIVKNEVLRLHPSVHTSRHAYFTTYSMQPHHKRPHQRAWRHRC